MRKKPKPVSEEDIAVAIAWVRGEVTLNEVIASYTAGGREINAYSRLARSLRQYVLETDFPELL